MERRHVDPGFSERKGQKRKLYQEEELTTTTATVSPEEEQFLRAISCAGADSDDRLPFLSEVASQVSVLNSSFSWSESDRSAAKRATHVLAELAKNGAPPLLIHGMSYDLVPVVFKK